ncbi:unnamed protein product, partial [Cladocopium goreaui]
SSQPSFIFMNAGLVVAAAGEQFYFPQTGILLDLKHGNLPTPLPKLVISFPLGEYCQMKMSLHFSSRTMNLQHTSILVWVQTSVLLKPQMLPVPSCTLMEMRSVLAHACVAQLPSIALLLFNGVFVDFLSAPRSSRNHDSSTQKKLHCCLDFQVPSIIMKMFVRLFLYLDLLRHPSRWYNHLACFTPKTLLEVNSAVKEPQEAQHFTFFKHSDLPCTGMNPAVCCTRKFVFPLITFSLQLPQFNLNCNKDLLTWILDFTLMGCGALRIGCVGFKVLLCSSAPTTLLRWPFLDCLSSTAVAASLLQIIIGHFFGEKETILIGLGLMLMVSQAVYTFTLNGWLP